MCAFISLAEYCNNVDWWISILFNSEEVRNKFYHGIQENTMKAYAHWNYKIA